MTGDTEAFDHVIRNLGHGSSVEALDILDAAAVESFVPASGRFDGLVFTPAMNIRKRIAQYSTRIFVRFSTSTSRRPSGFSEHSPRQWLLRVEAASLVSLPFKLSPSEPGQGVYAASKAALETPLRTVASEMEGTTCVCERHSTWRCRDCIDGAASGEC